MTPKQKGIIAILTTANIIVLLTLAIFMTRPPAGRGQGSRIPEDRIPTGEADLLLTPSPFPSPPRPLAYTVTPGQQACQWRATRLLAQAGLCGTPTLLPGGSLRFELTHRLPRSQTIDQAAQSVWTAFDVALTLRDQEDACATFTDVEAIIVVHDGEHSQGTESATDTEWGAPTPIGQIYASVRAADLVAFSEGKLSEDEFIERVIYTITETPN